MGERRQTERLQVYKALGIRVGDRLDHVGVTRNVSPTGALFHSANRFSIGDRLELLMQALDSEDELCINARVVRVEIEEMDSRFPHLTAVEFDTPLEDA